ncbi:TIGR04255 family protein [Mycolicibacterium farcinogenes]|uniref:TIGR04255 family protein n=1 Tax=Mycolicibacterium farcinogenes TaxID=1802 RepID=A0ACD1FIM6_MYCFR|nr:TIGR04255 family protein [Mycolicibacterium farcinogenes]QZH66924.1 TIGR04255 family protein [Mycolicibacterium farcinogenes]
MSDNSGGYDDIALGFRGLPPVINVGHRYENAPIVEATMALVVEARPDLSIAELAVVLERPEYQERTEVYTESSSEWSESGERVTSRTLKGFRALSEDGSHGVVVTPSQFSFSRVGTYDTWESFQKASEDCWNVYRKVAAPSRVTRASLRFVNLIMVPKPAYEIRDYLRTSFEVSPYLPQVVTSYYTQVEIPLEELMPDFSPTCLVTVSSTREGERGIILDIVASVSVDLDTQYAGFSDSLTDVLDKLRTTKNLVFESCITDATRGLIS